MADRHEHEAHNIERRERAREERTARHAEQRRGQRLSREQLAAVQAADRRRHVAQLDAAMSDREIDDYLDDQRQVGFIRGSSIGLAVLSALLLLLVTSLASYPAIAERLSLSPHPGLCPYVTVVAAFLSLMLRRQHPIMTLLVTSLLAGIYLALPWPPSIVILAPMTALFEVASQFGGRRASVAGIVLGVAVLGVSAMSVSVSYTVAQIVAIFALLGLSAALGHGQQTRRELFEELRLKREEEQLRRVEEERLRIARDVHDIMAHSLTLMTLQADAGLTSATDAEKTAAAFTIIGDTGRATLRDLRSMLSVLAGGGDESPREPVAELDQLETLVRSVRETGLDVALDAKPSAELADVPSAVSVSAYRIVQEALTNVVRHAQATRAEVSVHVADGKLTVTVVDNGVGAASGSAGGTGRGLLGMHERVEVLGGTITTGPRDGGGFEVRASIPLGRSSS